MSNIETPQPDEPLASDQEQWQQSLIDHFQAREAQSEVIEEEQAPIDEPPVEGEEEEEAEEEGEDEGDKEVAEEQPDVLTIAGRQFDPTQAGEMVQLYDWAASLPPEAATAINAVLSGTHVLVPREEYEQRAPIRDEPATTTSPEVDEEIEPAVASHIKALRDEIASLRQGEEQRARADQEVQQQRYVNAVETAREQFTEQFALSTEEMDRLVNMTVQAQIVPHFSQQYPRDPERAFREAFETMYYRDPSFRDREMQRQMAQEQADAQQITSKKRKAAALSGSAASVPRTPPTAQPQTKAQREQAMIDEIARAMSDNGSSG